MKIIHFCAITQVAYVFAAAPTEIDSNYVLCYVVFVCLIVFLNRLNETMWLFALYNAYKQNQINSVASDAVNEVICIGSKQLVEEDLQINLLNSNEQFV